MGTGGGAGVARDWTSRSSSDRVEVASGCRCGAPVVGARIRGGQGSATAAGASRAQQRRTFPYGVTSRRVYHCYHWALEASLLTTDADWVGLRERRSCCRPAQGRRRRQQQQQDAYAAQSPGRDEETIERCKDGGRGRQCAHATSRSLSLIPPYVPGASAAPPLSTSLYCQSASPAGELINTGPSAGVGAPWS